METKDPQSSARPTEQNVLTLDQVLGACLPSDTVQVPTYLGGSIEVRVLRRASEKKDYDRGLKDYIERRRSPEGLPGPLWEALPRNIEDLSSVYSITQLWVNPALDEIQASKLVKEAGPLVNYITAFVDDYRLLGEQSELLKKVNDAKKGSTATPPSDSPSRPASDTSGNTETA